MRSHFLQIKRACAHLTKVASAEARSSAGLHGAQAQALLVLSGLKSCRIGDLAAHLDLGKPAATTLVERMERENLVYRTSDQSDRRAQFIRITPEGQSAVSRVAKMISAFDAKLLEGFTAQDIEIIERYLEQAAKLERL